MYKDLHLNWIKVADAFDPEIISGQFLDYNIAGISLQKYLGIDNKNIVTPFGWFLTKDEEKRVLKEFRLQSKTQLPQNRIELYICGQCGDIGCGSITAQIFDKGDRIVWTNFANQSNEDEIGESFNVDAIEFERVNYFKAFSKIV